MEGVFSSNKLIAYNRSCFFCEPLWKQDSKNNMIKPFKRSKYLSIFNNHSSEGTLAKSKERDLMHDDVLLISFTTTPRSRVISVRFSHISCWYSQFLSSGNTFVFWVWGLGWIDQPNVIMDKVYFVSRAHVLFWAATSLGRSAHAWVVLNFRDVAMPNYAGDLAVCKLNWKGSLVSRLFLPLFACVLMWDPKIGKA